MPSVVDQPSLHDGEARSAIEASHSAIPLAGRRLDGGALATLALNIEKDEVECVCVFLHQEEDRPAVSMGRGLRPDVYYRYLRFEKDAQLFASLHKNRILVRKISVSVYLIIVYSSLFRKI